MKTWMVETQALKKYYRLGENTVKALDGVDLTVERGEFVAMIGKSGSGKSTLLHMLGGLDTPTSGEVFVDGKKLSELKKEQLAIFRRRKVGFVFQNYNLVPDLNVYENIVLPIELDGGYVDEKFIGELLDMLHLQEKAEALPGTLSGGQQQRVAIARALVNNPVMILADEATGNLDTRTSFEILTLFQRLHAEGSTIVFVTHNPEIAQFSSRNIVLRDGHITDDVRNGNIQSAQAVLDTIPVDNGM